VTFPAARIDLSDVPIVAVFIDQALERCADTAARLRLYGAIEQRAAAEGLAGVVVALWRDSKGRTRFIASPEQHRFFQTVRYEQIRAQADRELSCDL
jgi:hypothetical protein